MSEGGQSTVGQLLQQTREAQGVSVEDVGVRLRLMNRQVEAMEADDFESLGQPVFARGFVRNYARLLGLAPEPLLDRMAGAPAEPAMVSHVEPSMPHSWLTSPWLILLMLGMLVLVAAPVALYLWLNSEVDEGMSPVAPVAETRASPSGALPVAVPVVPSTATTDVSDASSGTATESTDAVEADTPAAPVAAAPGSSVVHLEFVDDSWVEVKDASGRMVHRQLNLAGSSVDIPGRPPFAMVIGNASQVRMTYNGRPIDLKPFVDVTVARFTLEE